jgi:hypothetical protein
MSYILNIQMLSLLNISDLEGLGSDSQERKLKLYELNKNLLEVSKQVLLCTITRTFMGSRVGVSIISGYLVAKWIRELACGGFAQFQRFFVAFVSTE